MTFVPLGLAIYYLVNYTVVLRYNYGFWEQLVADDIAYGPLCLTIGCAAIVGFFQTCVKIVKKKYVFENFHIMTVGMVLLIVGGGLMTIVGDVGNYLIFYWLMLII